jgi:hypothetical protein
MQGPDLAHAAGVAQHLLGLMHMGRKAKTHKRAAVPAGIHIIDPTSERLSKYCWRLRPI